MRSSLSWLARAGFAARGILYLLVGWLALREGRNEDPASALSYLEAGGGTAAVTIAAVALASYGLWRLANAAMDGDGHGGDAKGLAIRAGGLVSGIVHLGLAAVAARLAFFGRSGGDNGEAAQAGAASALDLPGGWLLLAGIAALLFATGLFQLVQAVKAGFLKRLDHIAARQSWVKAIGRAGYGARGLVFLVMAWLLWNAARDENAREAGGLGKAVASLPPSLELAVAAGLFLFGLFSLVEARYRRVSLPDGMGRL